MFFINHFSIGTVSGPKFCNPQQQQQAMEEQPTTTAEPEGKILVCLTLPSNTDSGALIGSSTILDLKTMSKNKNG